jgi:hypothetical protein
LLVLAAGTRQRRVRQFRAVRHARRGSHNDPAAFLAVNRSVLAVHPSATGDRLYTTALDRPGLRWQADRRTAEARDTWVSEIAAALEPASESAKPFAPLAAYRRTVELLSGATEPASDAEAR